MKLRILFLMMSIFLAVTIQGQQTVKGKLKSTGDAQLHVIRLLPDSYPQVALTFHATSATGAPVWNIRSEDVRVAENGQPAKVLRLRPITDDNGLQSALVIDHSGSMASDQRYGDWLRTLRLDSSRTCSVTVTHRTIIDPTNPERATTVKLARDTIILGHPYLGNPDFTWYKSPLHYAQQGALAYLNSMQSPKDEVGIIGFADRVDVSLPQARYKPTTRHQILGMRAEGGTAFYDAVDEALRMLVTRKGNRAVIALTDGNDNASRSSLEAVIALANKLKTPVYVIGLGNVNQDQLRQLAEATGGEFHYTTDPTRLSEIYRQISRQIHAIYEVVYRSPFLTSVTPEHDLQLTFDVDSMFLKSQLINLQLPAHVLRDLQTPIADVPLVALPADVEDLAVQETVVEQVGSSTRIDIVPEPEANEFPYGILLVSLSIAGSGALFVKSRYTQSKPPHQLQLLNLFPNPATGPLTLNFTADALGGPLQLTLISLTGGVVLTETINPANSTHTTDVSNLAAGTYLVQLAAVGSAPVTQSLLVSR